MSSNNMRLKSLILFLSLLFMVNLIAHFIPFERRSLAPDDYGITNWVNSTKPVNLLQYLTVFPDRPLNYIFSSIQCNIIKDNADIGLFFVFIISLLILTTVFFLLRELFHSNFLAFIGSAIYCLLPNKLETYHTPIYATDGFLMEIYLLSFLFFIFFVNKQKLTYFFLSLFTYSVGIFSHESGFFIPVSMGIYAHFFGKKGSIKFVLYFIPVAIFYAVYRLTGIFGLVDIHTTSRLISLQAIPLNLIELFHQYVGRYMIRNTIYGIYQFFFIESPWLVIIIISDIILLFITFRILKKQEIGKVNKYLLIVAFSIFFIFLAPVMLDKGIGVAGRHLILPSIGVVIFIIWLITKFNRYWRSIFIGLMTIMLIICQGNAWTQVVACRLNGAVYETIKGMKDSLITATNIVIDVKSFADKIPFTWVKRDFNLLNTYYGAQAFEDWGFENMIKLITSDMNKSVYVTKENPVFRKDGLIELEITKIEGYRKVIKRKVVLPNKGVIIINFKSVYGGNFNNGIRKK